MRGDITRLTFNPTKAYCAVRQQQGRVSLDADWNEQIDIVGKLSRTAIVDLLGPAAAPKNGGLSVEVSGGVLYLMGNRMYVGGILCESAGQVTLHDPAKQKVNVKGVYLAYIDVWIRTVTAVEDPDIREIALGGPDTTTRDQVVWTVRLAPLTANQATCATSTDAWNAISAPRATSLTARVTPEATSTDPCLVAPGAGYRGLENQLYRVEIHAGGTEETATFKWSRDNGAVLGEWLPGDRKDQINVRFIGRSAPQAVKSGDWVELTDDTRDLAGQAGALYRVTTVGDDVIGIDGEADRAEYPTCPKVRVWNSSGAISAGRSDTSDGYIKLEDGVEIKFGAGDYVPFDHWMIPARTEIAGILWPADATGAPAAQPSQGPAHHYAKLGIVELGDAGWSFLEDCRSTFDPLVFALSEATVDPFQITGLTVRKPSSDGTTTLHRDLMTGTLPARVSWNAFGFSTTDEQSDDPAYFTIRADVKTSLPGIDWGLATLWVFIDVPDVVPIQGVAADKTVPPKTSTDPFIRRFTPERLDGSVTTTDPQSENGMQVVSIEWTPTTWTLDRLTELTTNTPPNLVYPIRCELTVTQIDQGIIREAGRLSFYFKLTDAPVPVTDHVVDGADIGVGGTKGQGGGDGLGIGGSKTTPGTG